jgi:hypothetical protein
MTGIPHPASGIRIPHPLLKSVSHKSLPCNVQKKYFPFLVLILAALFFFWIKKNQRGPAHIPATIQTHAAETAPFDRNNGNIVYSKHAKCRMECRHIDSNEVKEIITGGTINSNKAGSDERGKTYPLEGFTRDGQHVRIVVAPHENELVVVTVIDLEKEWSCNCD